MSAVEIDGSLYRHLGRQKPPYLLLVTFYPIGDSNNFKALSGSAFDGVAIPIADAYTTDPLPKFPAVQARYQVLTRSSGKQIWPWVFINRMVGPAAVKAPPESQKKEFLEIHGVDVDNAAGARSAFLQMWRFALRQAKRSGVPGVVLDMEFYNNPAAYSLNALAVQRWQSPEQVRKKLIVTGDDMAAVVAQEYPDAIIWSLVTGLITSDGSKATQDDRTSSTRAYVLRGLLDGAKRRRTPLVLLDGGEDDLDYCHDSVVDLSNTIESRKEKFNPLRAKYGNSLELGGTIALWSEATPRTGWLKEGACGRSDVSRSQDFKPYLSSLFRSYDYVWIYAPIVGSYDPLDPRLSGSLDRVIAQAKQETSR